MEKPVEQDQSKISAETFIVKKITDFSKNIELVRAFINLVDPVIKNSMDEVMSTLSPKIQRLSPRIKKIGKVLRQTEKKSIHETKEVSLEIELKDFHAIQDFMDSFEKVKPKLGIPQHVLTTSLVSLISYVEVFVSQIVHFHFSLYPAAIISSTEKQFTYNDLQKLGSIDDARNFLIEKDVEALLRSSVTDWADYFEGKLKLEIAYLKDNIDQIREVFLRRNLFVHNAGIVNSTYLKGLKKSSDIKVGKPINIEKEYLDSAFTSCEIAFSLVALELLSKFQRKKKVSSSVCGKLHELVVSHVSGERYKIAEEVSKFISEDNSYSNADRAIARVNYWQAIKWQGRLDEIKKEIQEADFSGMLGLFALAKCALLDELDAFFKTLPSLVDTKEVSIEDLEEWPLFKEVRQSDLYREFLSSHAPKKSKKNYKPLRSKKTKPKAAKQEKKPAGKKITKKKQKSRSL